MEAPAKKATAGKKSVQFDVPPPTTTTTREAERTSSRQRPAPRADRYLTTGRQFRPGAAARDVATEPPPFCSDLDAAACREEALPAADKHTRRSRQQADLLQRLHVPDDGEEEAAGGASDAESGISRLVQGRPVKEKLDLRRMLQAPFWTIAANKDLSGCGKILENECSRLIVFCATNWSEFTKVLPKLLDKARGLQLSCIRMDDKKLAGYVADVRANLLGRLQEGYLRDETLLLDERLSREQRLLAAARDEHRSHAEAFHLALERHHEESMAVVRRHEEGSAELRAVLEQHRELQRRLSAARARVYVLAEAWAHCRLYQSFLYQVSPVTWRQEHGVSVSEADPGTTGRPVAARLPDEDSLEALIGRFSADVAGELRPELCFSEPDQLLRIFADMEHKNLDSMLHLEALLESLQEMQDVRKEEEENVRREVGAMSDSIAELKTSIRWEEERGLELENHARKLMSTTFKDLVVSDDLLRLKVFIEDTYEAVIARNEGNLKMVEMKTAIEARYDQLMLQLEKFPKSLVRETKREVFSEARRRMREARSAATKAELMERVLRRLKKALEPPFRKSGRPVHFRSPPSRPRRKPGPKPQELTQQQEDFLEFFSDYCRHTDSVGAYIPGF
ncbi:cilia- and flagella-associated protein 100-like [Bacillus rossius redtenbacheri]|uniref:cilia- and flagella-associated protein 100-like n=1 Tax=Bacillus rossius redtenbacheri TaxID=93214 RepID=UPI002FDC8366